MITKQKGETKNQKDEMYPLPPIRREIGLLLKEFCLNKTRGSDRLVTIGEILEKAILNFIDKKNKKY